MIMVDLDGKAWAIEWRFCRCNSYPIAIFTACGSCGNCKVIPQGNFDSRQESEQARKAYENSRQNHPSNYRN